MPEQFPLWPNLLNRLAPDVVEARKFGLQRYLTDAVAASSGGPLPAVLRDFLQLPPEEEDGRIDAPIMQPQRLEHTDTTILVANQLPVTARHAQPISTPVSTACPAHQHALSPGRCKCAFAVPAARPMVVMMPQVTRREAGGFDVEWNVDSVLNKASLRLPTRVIWVGCVNLRVTKVRVTT